MYWAAWHMHNHAFVLTGAESQHWNWSYCDTLLESDSLLNQHLEFCLLLWVQYSSQNNTSTMKRSSSFTFCLSWGIWVFHRSCVSSHIRYQTADTPQNPVCWFNPTLFPLFTSSFSSLGSFPPIMELLKTSFCVPLSDRQIEAGPIFFPSSPRDVLKSSQ